ncbi:TonB-dependent receptor [Pseudomaricurvus alcaniphilus]|uniref:TonB-dependent receptor n=1 Tax=Pseudomaricurvus alcaniphilus TaxID=1166482 RepID=UPI00140E86E4|nr:TonB-dependent receptor [Pseudomaricurvus alcaniphilus]NHN39242.1 TonB-dependent receptor [Pseudomaricurvus alcaniphilus]
MNSFPVGTCKVENHSKAELRAKQSKSTVIAKTTGLIPRALASAISLALLAPLATAQDNPRIRAAVEEVIVTAQKKEESLQDTPVAVSALTGNMLERTFATDLKAISGQVPSLVVSSVVNVGMTAAMTIRGIGVQEADGFIDPSVGVVLDGVYQGSNTTALLDLFDIEQVEVLRGPQGTLFGANTIGGVVNVKTRQPSEELEGSIKLTGGNYGRRDAAGMINVPISETLAARVAMMYKSFDGFYEDHDTGRDLGSQEVLSGRGYLKFTPSGNFDATLQYEYGRGRNGSPPVVNHADPGMAMYVPGYSQSINDAPHFKTTQARDASDYDIDGTTLTMNWDLGAVQLVSISNYRQFELDEWTDQDGTPVDIYVSHRVTNNKQASQELRADFSLADNVESTAGIFYFRQNWQLDSDAVFGPFALYSDPDQDDQAWSLFTQSYWHITDAVTVQAGLRYTWQEKELDLSADTQDAASGASLVPVTAGGKSDWENLGWRLGADWKVNDDLMLYGYQARGFKSGGFNARITFPEDIGPYQPEIVDTWEIGAKADWMNGILRTNAAIFYNDYQDLQVDQLVYQNNQPVTRVENAASAIIQGVELEVVWVPAQGLTINGSYSYLDAEYDEFFFDLDGNPANGQEDASSLALRNAPRNQGSLGVSYEMELLGGYTTFNAVWTYTGERQTDTRNHPVGTIAPLDLFDASIRWADANEQWSVALRGKNLSDEKYRASGFYAPDVMNFGVNGGRREVAVDLAYRF